jgi:hypothetical protein
MFGEGLDENPVATMRRNSMETALSINIHHDLVFPSSVGNERGFDSMI